MLPLRAQVEQTVALPVDVYKANNKGVVVVAVKFAEDGSVQSCRVVRSNAPFPLEAAVIDYVKRKWTNTFFAGETVVFPITFDDLPWYVTGWNQGLVPPPELLSAGDPDRKLKLRVTFGADGWVTKAQIVEPSGIDLVDHETAIWVRVHWHDDAYAGQTLDSPFEFKPPPLPKPKAHPKAKAPPAPPPEPAAAPAVRVE